MLKIDEKEEAQEIIETPAGNKTDAIGKLG